MGLTQEDKLCISIQNNDIRTAQDLIDAGVCVTNESPSFHEIPILKAARLADEKLNMIRLLNQAGASLETENKFGVGLLHYAVMDHNLPLVKFLVQSRVDLDRPDRHGVTPLILAVQLNHTDIVKCLIKGGALVRKRDAQKRMPFYWAVYTGHKEIAALLIKSGGFTKKIRVYTGIMEADKRKNEQIRQFLDNLLQDPHLRACISYRKHQNTEQNETDDSDTILKIHKTFVTSNTIGYNYAVKQVVCRQKM